MKKVVVSESKEGGMYPRLFHVANNRLQLGEPGLELCLLGRVMCLPGLVVQLIHHPVS